MSKPPPLPAEVLARVLSIATWDGRILLFVAGGFALLSALFHDVTGAVIGTLAAGAGAMELHGVTLLRTRDSRGVSWLVGSQLFLLGLILVYVAQRLRSFDLAWLRQQLTPAVMGALNDAGMSVDQFLALVQNAFQISYVTFAALSIVYQGGLALYYHRRRGVIGKVLQ